MGHQKQKQDTRSGAVKKRAREIIQGLMECNPGRIWEWLMRHWFLCVLLLAVGCRAQSPSGAELDRKIEKQVRSTFSLPPFVEIKAGERKPSTDFPGYDSLVVTLSYGGKSQTRDLLLSKDNKTLLSVTKMDLTRDPLAEVMAKIDVTGRPVRGNPKAKLLVVVYDDFQCPYCSRMHQTLNDVLKSYGDRIKVVYKDYPLFEIHPWAERAALDSGCLARQSAEAYWDFADYVHANPERIKGEQRAAQGQLAEVDKIAMEIGKRHSADEAALKSCVETQATKSDLNASVKEAESVGVESTPAVFIDGMKLDGAIPAEELRLVLDKELKSLGAPGQ
jgi:protein-disulfide isomerase